MFHTNGLIAVPAEQWNRDSIILLQIVLWRLQPRVQNLYVLHSGRNVFTIASRVTVHLSTYHRQVNKLFFFYFVHIIMTHSTS